jgi:hypothetical protein
MERPDKLGHHQSWMSITSEWLSDDYLSTLGSRARKLSDGFQSTVLVGEGNPRVVMMNLDDKLLASGYPRIIQSDWISS